METGTAHIKQGWVWFFALFLFFCNTFPLPQGISYTLLLTPFWVYLLYVQHRLMAVVAILLPLAVYAAIHLSLGVSLSYYLVSAMMLACVLIFAVTASYYIKSPEVNWDLIFRDIVILNFILALLCIPCLFIPALKPLVWYLVPVTKDVMLPRLKLFTYEASHYSFLLAIPFIYFTSRYLFSNARKPLLTIAMLAIPLLMSFALGVLVALAASLFILLLIKGKSITAFANTRKTLWLSLLVATIGVAILYFLFPDNPLFVRIRNIFSGDDTSARGRTYEAFILAHKIIQTKSELWGIGPGQLKLIGRNIIIQYYYYTNIPAVVRIPNACAETIIYFGYAGLVIRLLLQIILFVKTKVAANPFRLWLFLFLFMYQFTGSYITNASEYFMWMLAFVPAFPDFQKTNSVNQQTSLK